MKKEIRWLPYGVPEIDALCTNNDKDSYQKQIRVIKIINS